MDNDCCLGLHAALVALVPTPARGRGLKPGLPDAQLDGLTSAPSDPNEALLPPACELRSTEGTVGRSRTRRTCSCHRRRPPRVFRDLRHHRRHSASKQRCVRPQVSSAPSPLNRLGAKRLDARGFVRAAEALLYCATLRSGHRALTTAAPTFVGGNATGHFPRSDLRAACSSQPALIVPYNVTHSWRDREGSSPLD